MIISDLESIRHERVFENTYKENPDIFDNFFWGGVLGLGIGTGKQKKAEGEKQRAIAEAEKQRAEAAKIYASAERIKLEAEGAKELAVAQSKKGLYFMLVAIVIAISIMSIVILKK